MSKGTAVLPPVVVAIIMLISFASSEAFAVMLGGGELPGENDIQLFGPGVGGLVVAAMIGALVIAKKRRRK